MYSKVHQLKERSLKKVASGAKTQSAMGTVLICRQNCPLDNM
ncbi:hypothetical protein MAMMFC1_01599 [Methylomusa anaerophila]|uniref:Uncharacterized protein n=1 Tax=Methylomusa anaerophila TaxID=1930071 RepID=A0A348AIN4_9FIRM|nr:hypothetical protein MAMMFC1_01599 [Methylomusa anaerophila]